MHHNHRPVLVASELPVTVLDLKEGQRPMMACLECGRWRFIADKMLMPHHVEGTRKRCPGSGQRVHLDVDAARFAVLRGDGADASLRRGTRVIPRPKPPVAPPLAHLGRERRPRRAQTAGWSAARAADWLVTKAARPTR